MRFSRRKLLAALPLVAVAGGAALAIDSSLESSLEGPEGLLAEGASLWEIPDAAWKRVMGSHPAGVSNAPSPTGSSASASRTKRGIPVGGIGTGSFMFNLCGSFGPWHMDIGGDDSEGSHWGSIKNSGFEARFLPGAAFHVRLTSSAGTMVRTLATEDTLASWTGLDAGDGVYSALFPKAWFEYFDLDLPVSLKQFSPFVARDERTSSLPAGIFEIALDNPTTERVEVSCMFSFPNAPFRLPTSQYEYTRRGLRSHSATGPGTVGVRLQAQDRANVPETDRTEWVIAAKGPSGCTLSFTEDWAADGDGSDLLDAFSASGQLPNKPLDPRRQALGGAVAVSFSLEPRQRKAATFVLAWDFPVVQFRNPVAGTRWWKRYTQWYPGSFRGWDIASDVISSSGNIERSIDAWWNRVAVNPTYPLWLRCAALNELYYDVFGGVFWENGCITKPKRIGARPGQHLYFTLETEGFRDCESMDVRHYETRHLLQLFPTIERDVLLGWADMVNEDPIHRTPHDAGSPVDDPWFVVNQYSATRPGEPPMRIDWLDIPAKFVQQVHAYWSYTGDDGFASEAYPAAKRAILHLLSRDLDGDGIPDADGFCTTYDNIEMVGATTYVAALTIGACEAMADLARVFDTQQWVERWKAQAAQARDSAESALWSKADGFYILGSEGDYGHALMADALCGERYAASHHLPDVLEVSRMDAHLSRVYEHNVLPLFSGRYGAVNAVDPSGGTLQSFQARAVWPGGSYFTAALMYSVGRASNNDELLESALDTAYGVYRTTYEDDDTAFWFDTPAEWLPQGSSFLYRAGQYQRCRAAWELMLSIHDPFPPGWTPDT